MSLENIFPKNPSFTNMIKDQGFDLDSLLFMSKDLFGIFNDLKFANHEVNDFMLNLKSAYDSKQGRVVYEDNQESPVKITVTNSLTNKIVYFTLCNNDPSAPKFSCELCAQIFRKNELKKHIIDHEAQC